jgi:hypothetical protein
MAAILDLNTGWTLLQLQRLIKKLKIQDRVELSNLWGLLYSKIQDAAHIFIVPADLGY